MRSGSASVRAAAGVWKLCAAAGLLAMPAPAAAVETSFELNLNAWLGAERFYDAGYTGGLTVQANVEGGNAWAGHESLGHIAAFFHGEAGPGTGNPDVGEPHDHATGVSHLLGGRPASAYDADEAAGFGIAFDATLWSGGIGWNFRDDGSFDLSDRSVGSTYVAIVRDGVDGQRADVLNGSWGAATDRTGTASRTIGLDGLVTERASEGAAPVMVWAAGNAGDDPNTVGQPASGFNGMTVGALGPSDADDPVLREPWYDEVAFFSSRGPQDFQYRDGAVVEQVRAAVDIAAPGTLVEAAMTIDDPGHYEPTSGTSVAAPLVAGGASLLIDAGRREANFAHDPDAVDGRVVKAVLLNSADKTADWDNGLEADGETGVLETQQSLDWAAGAGRMNLDRAFDQYLTAGTTGVQTAGGEGDRDLGLVSNVGWNYGFVNDEAMNSYFIEEQLLGGSDFTATLTWLSDRDPGELDPSSARSHFNGAEDEHFANLHLSVFRFDDLDDLESLETVAQSVSRYNTVEHLHFELPEDGYYGLGVRYDEALWNTIGADGESYGLAWSATVVPLPAPATLGAVLLAGMVLPRRRPTRWERRTLLGR